MKKVKVLLSQRERTATYTLHEIAEALEVPIRTVRQHVTRKILKTTLELRRVDLGSMKRNKTKLVHIVSRTTFERYRKYVKLRYKPRNYPSL